MTSNWFYLEVLPPIVPNVVIGTENVVTHSLPNFSNEKSSSSFPPLFFLLLLSSDRLGSGSGFIRILAELDGSKMISPGSGSDLDGT